MPAAAQFLGADGQRILDALGELESLAPIGKRRLGGPNARPGPRPVGHDAALEEGIGWASVDADAAAVLAAMVPHGLAGPSIVAHTLEDIVSGLAGV
jgi:hypothetical protein